MCCFQAANFSNDQREIPEQLLAFLERIVVFLDPTNRAHAALQTTVISSAGLAGLSRNFSSAQVSKRVCWENTHPNTLVACRASGCTFFRRSQLFQALKQCTLTLLKFHTHLAQCFFFKTIILKSCCGGGGVFFFLNASLVVF